METATFGNGVIYFANNRHPKSLADWNAQYEALSPEQDWWFKAGVALVAWVRSLTVSMARAAGQFSTNTAPRAAHA
jgi:hypothetical protein